MNQIYKYGLIACCGAAALVGCGDTTDAVNGGLTAIENGVLVNPAWVEQNRDDLVVVDVRGEREFNRGHIEGAVSIGWSELANMSVGSTEPGWGQLNSPEQIQAVLQAKGVRQGQTAVVYTESLKSWGDETRVAWSLQSAGMDIKVLDGGIKAWVKGGYSLSKVAADYPVGDFTVDSLNASINITTDELVARLNDEDLIILDTREAAEHEGKKNYGEKSKGVIPNSRHQFFKDFYSADGTVKDAEAVTAMMTELGISKDDEIVVYCTGGVRSSLPFYALHQAGFSKVRNYDGSFSDWAATDQPMG